MNIRIESFKGYTIIGNAWVCTAFEEADPIEGVPNCQHFDSPNGFAFNHAFDWVADEVAGIVR